MKPIILLSTIVLATATPLLAADQSYDFKEFSRIEVRGDVHVDVRFGEAWSVGVEVSRRSLLRRIEVRQSGDTLIIERRRGSSFFLFGLADRYTVTVSLPELQAVTASAGSGAEVTGKLAASAAMKATSGADLDLRGAVSDAISLAASSGAGLEAAGSCGSLTARASSGAAREASGLVCDHVDLRASSGGGLDAHATEAASARASSGGDIRLHGPAATQDLRDSSGGSVRVAG